MRILLDTAIWFLYVRNQPLPATILSSVDDPENQICLNAISVMEIVQKWRIGKLDCPHPEIWLDQAIAGFEILPITEPIARKAALWKWEHKDPADRLIAASACMHNVALWHCDTALKDLDGFPQRYFKGPPIPLKPGKAR